MKHYKCLNKQVFEFENYKIMPIHFEDRISIMKWRNEQVYHLRQNKLLTIKEQDDYFNSVVNNLFEKKEPNQILFSFYEKDEFVGYGGLVHINWIDKNAEISFVMNTELESQGFEKYWGLFLKLIEIVSFEELNLKKIFTYAFDLRPKLYNALHKSNFKKEAVLHDHCFFNDTFIDVLIHSKNNSNFKK